MADDKVDLDTTKYVTAGVLAVGALAAVGVTGDLLTRAVRNLPLAIALAVAAVFVAVGILLWRSPAFKSIRRPLLGVIATLVLLVGLGALSHGIREVPQIRLSGVLEDDGSVSGVSIEASGSGLRSQETMAVQVLVVERAFTSIRDSGELCRRAVVAVDEEALVSEGVEVMSWAETGPDTNGDATYQAFFPAGELAATSQVCAYAALLNRADDGILSWLDFGSVNRPAWAVWVPFVPDA